MANQLNNILLCYHGCVPQDQLPFTFRSHPNDIQEHIVYLIEQGYKFVLPSDYSRWQRGEWEPDYPICSVHFDDGLESIQLVLPWFIDHKIPFGLAIISSKQHYRLPERDFSSWAALREYVESGLCELMNHTHNMHHLTVNDVNGSVGPILDSPWWNDNGMVMYRDAGDTRPIWDGSYIDKGSMGFPLFGTDAATLDTNGNPLPGANGITSEITFKSNFTGNINYIRFWLALTSPSGAGYDANIEISIDGTVYFNGIFKPKKYSTRTQWVEREMASIKLDTPMPVVSGSSYTIKWKTLNTGRGLAKCYAIADGSGDFSLTSDCVSVIPGVSTGDFIVDYPPGSTWDAKPLMILADGTGSNEPDVSFLAKIQEDLTENNNRISEFLYADWDEHKGNYDENLSLLYQCVAFGYYSDGTPVDSKFRYRVTKAHTAYTMAVKYTGEIGKRYPLTAEVYIGQSSTGPWTLVGKMSPNFAFFKWHEFDLDNQYSFDTGDYWIRFKTINSGYVAPTVLRLYVDATDATTGVVMLKPDLSDTITGSVMNGHALISTWHKATTKLADPPKSMIYPFGAYNDNKVAAEVKGLQDISPGLKTVMGNVGLIDGQTVWPTANRIAGTFAESSIRHSEYALSRMLIYGDKKNTTIINNIAAFAGTLFKPVVHGGVKWQTSIERDGGGIATVREKYRSLSYVAVDAYYGQEVVNNSPQIRNSFDEDKALLYVGAAFGSYSDNTLVDSKFLFNSGISFQANKLRVKIVNALGSWYSMTVNIYIGQSSTGPWTNIGSFTPQDLTYQWIDIPINTTQINKGDYWVRFETLTANPNPGTANILRIYLDNIDTVIGAEYLQTEGSDTWTGSTAQGRAFISALSIDAPVYWHKERMNDNSKYIEGYITGIIKSGDTLTGPSGSAIVEWNNNMPYNQILKFSSVTGQINKGDSLTGPTGSVIVDFFYDMPDEKQFMKSVGLDALLIISNYNGVTKDIDSALASIIVNNPTAYINAAKSIVQAEDWDGITINLEAVPASDRDSATDFVKQMAAAMHSINKLCHMTAPAATGTSYDSQAWVGWCDHAELIKYVDAMKIMSYTESGYSGSLPAPHAPDDFWNSVYFNMLSIIPGRFRGRILCGCNMFGHLWNDSGSVSYSSYWDALAEGLLRGADIAKTDSEGSWSAYGFASYFGIPDTIVRSVREAINKGFMGNGSWKGDDGNVEHFYPTYPQLGRDKKE